MGRAKQIALLIFFDISNVYYKNKIKNMRYNIYYAEQDQASYDNGVTWEFIGEVRKGALYKENAFSCDDTGTTQPIYREVEGTSYCDGTTKITPTQKQVSYNNGQTWQTTATTYVKYENSVECGYVIRTRTITGDSYCEDTTKVTPIYHQESYDNGRTWITISTEYDRIEKSEECGYIPPIYKDVVGDYTCDGTTKVIPTYHQVSYDNGETWETIETTYERIEKSEECGYIPPIYRWTDTTNYCSGTTKVYSSEHQVSYDNGETWETFETSIVAYRNSIECGYSHTGNCYVQYSMDGSDYIDEFNDDCRIPAWKYQMGSDIGDKMDNVIISDGITIIGDYSFFYNSNITNVHLGNNVAWIGDGAFLRCDNITGVIELPDSVEYIGEYAFRECSGITSINIPNKVTSINDGTFMYCYGLTSINIPNKVTNIGGSAFENCINLTSVTIPDSVTSIGQYAFAWDIELTDIYYNGTKAQWDNIEKGENWDDMLPENYVIHYTDSPQPTPTPTGTCYVEYTINNENTIDNFDDCIIPSNKYWNRKDIENVVIGNGITSIGQNAFRECSGITSVTLSDSLETIGDYVFDGCRSLTSITIPNTVTSIGRQVFSWCYKLTSVTIPDSVTIINDRLFDRCIGLTTLNIGSRITSFNYASLGGCTSLTTINYNGTIAQWNNIEKGENWKADVPSSCIVHCTDGDISI